MRFRLEGNQQRLNNSAANLIMSSEVISWWFVDLQVVVNIHV